MTTPEELRSRTMRAVRSKDTKPEMIVRRLVHGMGFRYRLHKKELPGSPDLVFVSRRRVVFVHGCFWHGHTCARGARTPKSNAEYWRAKIERNQARDGVAETQLIDDGWNVLTLWECELRDRPALQQRLTDFLSAGP